MKKHPLLARWPVILATIAAVGTLFTVAMHRIKIDTDVAQSLPQKEKIIADASYIFKNHPVHDLVVLDISCRPADPDALVDGADLIEERIMHSGLFKASAADEMKTAFPELLALVTENLPFLFSEKELQERVAPMLGRDSIALSLQSGRDTLLGLEGIGQAEAMSKDPLGLRMVVLERMRNIAPSTNVRMYRNRILSHDGRHCLIVARPRASGTDTATGNRILSHIESAEKALNERFSAQGKRFTVTSVGAFRAALDNEKTAREDTERALFLATAGIILLLFFAFRRPWLGALSLVPATAGTMIALFTYSLFQQSISILTLGYGAAIISITVDFGTTYFLFLDRAEDTEGREASHEVWSIGVLATLTTVGAFLALVLSGFSILAQIGVFAAMGIVFSFLFVHIVFPLIFPVLPAARKKMELPLHRAINRISLSGGRPAALAVVALMVFFSFFARPRFETDISTMNNLSESTRKAERHIISIWGDIYNRITMVIEARSMEAALEAGDRFAGDIGRDRASGAIAEAYIPSSLMPGETRRNENLRAWKAFWGKGRAERCRGEITALSTKMGFAPDAFAPFYRAIARPQDYRPPSREVAAFAGVVDKPGGGGWILSLSLTPGNAYDAESFYRAHTTPERKIFDSRLFSKKLGTVLTDTFVRMVLIVGLSALLLLFLFYWDLTLTVVTIIPLAFAMITTLGTINLLGQPLSIPGLMLSNVIIGAGIDYSIYFVCAYQRYGSAAHPSQGLIRIGVFLAVASNLIGFAALLFSDHAILRNVGVVSMLGIGFSFIGAILFLPPVLARVFDPGRLARDLERRPRSASRRVLMRFRHLEAHPRLFARFKMRLDPLFREILSHIDQPKVLLDIGCGFGIPAAWILEHRPGLRIHAIDPDAERCRIAARIIGNRGTVRQGSAPRIPLLEEKADTVLMLDMAHYLTDEEFRDTLAGLRTQMSRHGRLVIRATVPGPGKVPMLRRVETLRNRLQNQAQTHRSIEEFRALITAGGFAVEKTPSSGTDREEVWIIARRKK